MTDYDKNTQLTAQGAEQNAEPPVESQVVQKKKSLADKIAGALLSDDYRMIFSNIYRSIIEPAIKKLAVEAFKAFVYRGKPSGETFDSYTAYDSYSSGGMGSESHPHREFGEIQFHTRDDAERVLARMKAVLRERRLVCVSDYYKIANQRPDPSYFNWGWMNLNAAYVFHYRDGKNGEVWTIYFPEPVYIDRSGRGN